MGESLKWVGKTNKIIFSTTERVCLPLKKLTLLVDSPEVFGTARAAARVPKVKQNFVLDHIAKFVYY